MSLLAPLQVLGEAFPWRPFRDPMPLEWFDQWWLFVIPLAVMVAVVYKAARMYEFRAVPYARAVAAMSVQILLGLVGLALASYLLVEVYVKWLRG